MLLFGIKAYRRRGLKWKKTKNIKVVYPNILMTTYPVYPNHIWTADFTHLNFQGKIVYIATVMDLFTRRIVGLSVYTNHAVQLVMSAFMNAIYANPRPMIFHSDNGSEYNSEVFIEALQNVGVLISRSAPGCPCVLYPFHCMSTLLAKSYLLGAKSANCTGDIFKAEWILV